MIPVRAGVAAELAAVLAAVLTGTGVAQALAAAWLVRSFARSPAGTPAARPPVTVLKPLHGNEPLLEAALGSFCQQAYPDWQIVFGVQDASDTAIPVVRQLQARFPHVDMDLVIDPAMHGANRKVGNLINMFPAARHDIVVIADSDVHVRPDYLDRLVAALEPADVGLVTTLYAGLPVTPDTPPGRGRPSLPSRFGATQITHGFLPGAVLSRAVGRQDCLGATMCLRRRDLERIGGLRALVDHLADDNVLGRRIAGLGMRVALARTVPMTTVPETTLTSLFRHELRWARTIRALEPAGFAASVLQYPLFWALLAILLSQGAPWSAALFLLAWVLRAVAAISVDAALLPLWTSKRGSPASGENNDAALAFSCPVWLLPLRDFFSVAVMLASYGGRRVDWRGHGLHADTPPPFTPQTTSLRPIKGNKTR